MNSGYVKPFDFRDILPIVLAFVVLSSRYAMTNVLKISFITLSTVGILILLGRVRDLFPQSIGSKVFTTIALAVVLFVIIYATLFNVAKKTEKK